MMMVVVVVLAFQLFQLVPYTLSRLIRFISAFHFSIHLSYFDSKG
jgi:hypothetical protein